MAFTLKQAADAIGAQVIAAAPRDSDDATIVLAHVPSSDWSVLPPQPYVTWLFNPETGILVWGHYFDSQEQATLDFNRRTADSHRADQSPAKARKHFSADDMLVNLD